MKEKLQGLGFFQWDQIISRIHLEMYSSEQQYLPKFHPKRDLLIYLTQKVSKVRKLQEELRDRKIMAWVIFSNFYSDDFRPERWK